MKPTIISFLLDVLNSRFLNGTPCEYGFIGNIDAFSYENLRAEEYQQPGIMVREVLEAADRFRSCPIGKSGVTVIDGDGSHEATAMELHELRRSLDRP